MIKKILLVLVTVLSLMLIGLSVLYFNFNNQTYKQNSILSFVPPSTELILRIKETSKTTNSFVSNPIVLECLQLEELKKYWNVIDSITSRNYKTSEILQQSTTYICLDSSLNYLVLVDIKKMANQHFIDQFLVNSTSLRKIENFKEGYKAFYPQQDQPLYYYVRNNVFGISKNTEYLKSSLDYSITNKLDPQINTWNQQSSSNLSIWGKQGTENQVLNTFTKDNFVFGGWLDKFATTFWFDISFDNKKLSFNGELHYDSLNAEIAIFAKKNNNNKYFFFQSDTGIYKNEYYNLFTLNSLKQIHPLSFMYYAFQDTALSNIELLVSNSPAALVLFKSVINDPSVQLIPMADPKISQIAVMNRNIVSEILPVVPFKIDTGVLFLTIYNNHLFVSTSTETMLQYASKYLPTGAGTTGFVSKSIAQKMLLFSSCQIKFKNLYKTECSYQWGKENRISFSSEIALSKSK